MPVLTPRFAAERHLTEAAEAKAEREAGEICASLPLNEKVARCLTQVHRINGEWPVWSN
jgi:hypothetical protein